MLSAGSRCELCLCIMPIVRTQRSYSTSMLMVSVVANGCCVQELSEKLIVVVGSDELSKEAQRNATTTFMTNLRATLASKRVLGEYM